jgi:hypothetical protein
MTRSATRENRAQSETVVPPPLVIFRGTLGEFLDKAAWEQAVDRAVKSAGGGRAELTCAFLDIPKSRISVAVAIS